MSKQAISGELLMPVFGLCENCGKELHEGEHAKMRTFKGIKEYSCIDHEGWY